MSAPSGPSSIPATADNSTAARPWWQLGILGGVAAAVLNLIVYAIAVGPANVDLQVSASPGSSDLQDLAIAPVVFASFLPALLAAGLAALLAARTAAPRRWFTSIAGGIFLLSLVSILPLDVSTGAKLTLAILHLVAAAAIVAALLPRLAAEEQRVGH